MNKHLLFPENPLLCTKASKKSASDEKKEASVANNVLTTKIKLEKMGFSVFKF